MTVKALQSYKSYFLEGKISISNKVFILCSIQRILEKK